MAAQILEEISQDEIEQMRIFDQLLYEADKLAEESYRQRVAIENNTLQIAKNFKMKNFPLDAISESTGISIDVLQSL